MHQSACVETFVNLCGSAGGYRLRIAANEGQDGPVSVMLGRAWHFLARAVFPPWPVRWARSKGPASSLARIRRGFV